MTLNVSATTCLLDMITKLKQSLQQDCTEEVELAGSNNGILMLMQADEPLSLPGRHQWQG